MKKFVLLSILFSSLVACVTPRKPVDANSTFDTGIGFKVQPPPKGSWYEINSPDGTGYILGREPSAQDKQDGSSVIAEVRWGYIDLKGFKLKTSNDVFKFYENGLLDKRNTDRFESTKSDFKTTKFKTAECMSYEQTSLGDKMMKSFKGESLNLQARGLLCLHPKDKSRYVRITMSQRIPNSRKFLDLKSDETQFYDRLVFGELTGTSPY